MLAHKRFRVFPLFPAMLPIMIGIVVILGEFIWSSYRIRSTWPLTTGTVLSSQTLTGKGKYGDPTYGVRLAIQYVANGHTYVGNAQTYVWTPNYQEHLNNLRAYPSGSSVQVRYNPADHSALHLSPDLIESVPMSAVFGIVVVGTILGVAFVKSTRTERLFPASDQ